MRAQSRDYYQNVDLDENYRPWHWLFPCSFGTGDLEPVCGYRYTIPNRRCYRVVERSKLAQLTCLACRQAYLDQKAQNQRKGLR